MTSDTKLQGEVDLRSGAAVPRKTAVGHREALSSITSDAGPAYVCCCYDDTTCCPDASCIDPLKQEIQSNQDCNVELQDTEG